MADKEMDSAAPPSYESLHPAGTSDAKGDFKDDKSDDLLTDAGPSSSSQLHAPPGAAKVMDWEEYRKRDIAWPRGPRLRTTAVYGLYCERKSLYAQPHTLKITDYNGGILFHFLFPLQLLVRPSDPFFKRSRHIFMVSGEQTTSNPRAETNVPGSRWQKGPQPSPEQGYVWTTSLLSQPLEFRCADDRVSRVWPAICTHKEQIDKHDLEPHRRDLVKFNVPTSRQSDTTRTFVWSSSGLVRNHSWSRWDEVNYCLYEDGDMTRIYGIFRWQEGSAIDLREIPDDLEHSLIFFALGYLLLMQSDMASTWPPRGPEQARPDPPRFSVAALREKVAELMSIE
ncbi:hypothetical protein BDZ90DRAFT_281260 [Jaminaea rosea]|uniref:Uncharacterized protein n=1 Tax=Jaminaea rosea TaxID=1569628 RepID=A0A316UND8_9BASI|nr:hypothetical protein BDZ90DRAFT_281260 [Jaminaea rosea]PWN25871.1 hypothetical protein BDZ90DRAFT_281260 [Jaminaea rosea]